MGLGEALAVTLLIYTMFTLSTIGARFDFTDQSLWTLQFLMLGTGAVSLLLVARNVKLRKHDIEAQHDLVVAHDRIVGTFQPRPADRRADVRRYFDPEFEAYLALCRHNQNQIQFMLLDVDDFKVINDVCGHEAGDRVLQNIGRAFGWVLGGHGDLVRMGGDEFAVLFADLDPTVIATRALKTFVELNADSKYPEMARHASVSIGVASVPPDVEIGYRQFYKQADIALYRAKNQKDAQHRPTLRAERRIYRQRAMRPANDVMLAFAFTLWNQKSRTTGVIKRDETAG